MSGQNCWEAKNCGRGPGGGKVAELGVCPAATDAEADGLNGGVNGGRICWSIAGTFCGGTVQGTFAQKRLTCLGCDFFFAVQAQQGFANFHLLNPGKEYDVRCESDACQRPRIQRR